MRLDKYLVENNFFTSRERAIEAIKSGYVFSDGIVIKKASETKYGEITISDDILKYVSRAGLKLEKAIEHFKISFLDKTVLDVGASTGGFTEVSLLSGAKLVYAVDVGTNQLHTKLKSDSRVINYEKTNIINFDFTSKEIDIVLMDVSFVSVTKLLPSLFQNNFKEYVILIKPQFETGGLYLEKGIIKSQVIRQNVVDEIKKFVMDFGFKTIKITSSPIRGKNGNKEFIMYLRKEEE